MSARVKKDEAEVGFEVELEAPPPVLFPNEEVEDDPSIVEGGGDGRENVMINNNGVPQQQKTWYSKTIGKVAILFVAVFAVCIAIGYGSGYGINEKILSNKAAASVSSAKNGAYETYDTPPTAAKAAKSTGPTDTKSSKDDGSTKSVSYSYIYHIFICFSFSSSWCIVHISYSFFNLKSPSQVAV